MIFQRFREWIGSGIVLTVIGDRLQVTGPADRMTVDMRVIVKSHKSEILDLIEAWTERSAIMEFDGGMSRVEADIRSIQCLESEIREKRFARMVRNEQTESDSPLHTPLHAPEKTGSQIANIAPSAANDDNKVAAGCVNIRQPDHQLNWS